MIVRPIEPGGTPVRASTKYVRPGRCRTRSAPTVIIRCRRPRGWSRVRAWLPTPVEAECDAGITRRRAPVLKPHFNHPDSDAGLSNWQHCDSGRGRSPVNQLGRSLRIAWVRIAGSGRRRGGAHRKRAVDAAQAWSRRSGV